VALKRKHKKVTPLFFNGAIFAGRGAINAIGKREEEGG
jgi:hypothetical protein